MDWINIRSIYIKIPFLKCFKQDQILVPWQPSGAVVYLFWIWTGLDYFGDNAEWINSSPMN